MVDSTVFPTVPAPTITLTIMANAHRIASLSAAGFLIQAVVILASPVRRLARHSEMVG